jgi:hypothetical protein
MILGTWRVYQGSYWGKSYLLLLIHQMQKSFVAYEYEHLSSSTSSSIRFLINIIRQLGYHLLFLEASIGLLLSTGGQCSILDRYVTLILDPMGQHMPLLSSAWWPSAILLIMIIINLSLFFNYYS